MTRLTTFAVSLLAAVVVVVVGTRYLATDSEPVQRFETVPLSATPNHVAVIGDSYTAGFENTGRGPANWTEQAWRTLARRGMPISADVAAEGGAGYGVRGNHGSLFSDLAARAVQPDDALVVFFGSRNDQDVDPGQLTANVVDTLGLARRVAPSARLLVIGPPWPTADVPPSVLWIRDMLSAQAIAAGGEFVDPLAARWFVDRPELIGPDGVHPTDAGQTYMAEKIAPLISTELPKRA
ncbi:Rv0518 family GDSL lipase [Mycolicibacter acidiphilus]|uniref:Rv0518 family GDSL lipase n=1 Tax=Mycolicibacter acidiphilus TaxID=2835306 RepID=UPI0027DD9FE8|nr:GDSL lipase [Mycolicibacter acidiphilus]